MFMLRLVVKNRKRKCDLRNLLFINFTLFMFSLKKNHNFILLLYFFDSIFFFFFYINGDMNVFSVN